MGYSHACTRCSREARSRFLPSSISPFPRPVVWSACLCPSQMRTKKSLINYSRTVSTSVQCKYTLCFSPVAESSLLQTDPLPCFLIPGSVFWSRVAYFSVTFLISLNYSQGSVFWMILVGIILIVFSCVKTLKSPTCRWLLRLQLIPLTPQQGLRWPAL